MYNKIFLKKNLIEVGSSHLYATFGTFWVQIGPFLEAQGFFEISLKKVKCRFPKKDVASLISKFSETLNDFALELGTQYVCEYDIMQIQS